MTVALLYFESNNDERSFINDVIQKQNFLSPFFLPSISQNFHSKNDFDGSVIQR